MLLGAWIGFIESKRDVAEASGVIAVCVEVCEGILKRDVQITVEPQSYTAMSKH